MSVSVSVCMYVCLEINTIGIGILLEVFDCFDVVSIDIKAGCCHSGNVVQVAKEIRCQTLNKQL